MTAAYVVYALVGLLVAYFVFAEIREKRRRWNRPRGLNGIDPLDQRRFGDRPAPLVAFPIGTLFLLIFGRPISQREYGTLLVLRPTRCRGHDDPGWVRIAVTPCPAGP